MATHGHNATFAGPYNQGSQIVTNSGTVNNYFGPSVRTGTFARCSLDLRCTNSCHTDDPRNADFELNFLYSSNYESYKNDNPERVPGTCAWFLEHQTFLEWKTSSRNDLLWLSADPGCGKSVLSQALVDEKLVGTSSATICYFFFKDNDEQNNIATALCALLHQFFCKNENLLQKHVTQAVKKYGHALKNNWEELWRILVSAAPDASGGEVVCILDALDECRELHREKLIAYLEDLYSHASDKSEHGSRLKFLVTSRPYDDIDRGFRALARRAPTYHLAGEYESDNISREIGIVMESKFKDIAEDLRLDEDTRKSLYNRLCNIPNRTYLWLHLTLDELKRAQRRTEKKLLNLVDTLPRSVKEAYEKILARCEQPQARTILQIIVAAHRPLTLGEMDVALEIQVDTYSPSRCYTDLDCEGEEDRKSWIRDSCGLFVSIVNSRVFLIPQTAREFLIWKSNASSALEGWQHSIGLRDAHQTLAKICLTHLLFPEIQHHQVRADYNRYSSTSEEAAKQCSRQFPFLEYSANYWISHMQEANMDDPSWVSKAAELCEVGNISPSGWFVVYFQSEYTLRAKPGQSALAWAVTFGLVPEARYLLHRALLSHEPQINITNALKIAAASNNRGRALMEVFLERPKHEVQITEEVVKAAASNFSSSGEDIMALLFEQRGNDVQITEEVVKAAASNRGSGTGIMALLLKQRSNEVQITEEVVKTTASNRGSGTGIMALLLKQRSNEVQITEEVVKAAASNRGSGTGIMALLLKQQGFRSKLIETVIRPFIEYQRQGRPPDYDDSGNMDQQIMVLLLTQMEDQVEVPEQVLVKVVRMKSSGHEIIAHFLKQNYKFGITEKVLKATASNENCGKDIMAFFLEQRGIEFRITEEVTKAAASNNKQGGDIMALLLEKRYNEVQITEEVVEAAASNQSSGEKILAILLKQRSNEVQVIEASG